MIISYLQANLFANLADYGANDLAGNFLPWKWQQGTTADGKMLGLGTDVGSMAMCYRTDLFKEAGLPTDRDAVGKLWPTWDDYIKTGRSSRRDPKNNVHRRGDQHLQHVLMQKAGPAPATPTTTRAGAVLDTNPAVKESYDLAIKILDAGLSAKLQAWTQEWNAGFKNGPSPPSPARRG